ncbi:MAG: hypothetical protein JW925_05740 [Syntrophaceae bacterium]|nr:hypothetical protein [Syntrophaceae bacterium]
MKIPRHVFVTAGIFGSLPVLGWLVSLPYNWWALGEPYTARGEWNNLPLWLVTMPLNRLAMMLSDSLMAEDPYLVVLIYTALCSVIYAVIGTAISICVQWIITKLKKSAKT